MAAMSIASCTTDGGNKTDSGNDSIPAEQPETVDSSKVQEVTGEVVDGARRLIDLAVDGDTLNFELESSEDVSWEIGDKLTIRYYMRPDGDSVVSVINHSEA